METQIKSFYKTPQGMKFVTIFGYTSRAIPSLEINGVGKLSKNIKEKLIFVTRTRKLTIPQKRFVICVEMNEIDDRHSQYLKWLEFPLLLMFWYLSGLLPISRLSDCLTSGMVNSNGEVIHLETPENFSSLVSDHFPSERIKNMKYIGNSASKVTQFWYIDSQLLLEHIPDLKFEAHQALKQLTS